MTGNSDSKKSPGQSRRQGAAAAARSLKVRVKTAKRRKISSTRWLQRQLNDPYVIKAQAKGYRSRAAFKLLQLDAKLTLMKSGDRVIDLGAAPGGWTQVALQKVGPKGRVVGIDLQEIEEIPGADLIQMDFYDAEAPALLKKLLGGEADLVMSGMAAASIGHAQTDHLRIMALAETALAFALEVLAPKGKFVAKVLQGGTEKDLLVRLRENFDKVRHIKPEASRADSAEMYVVATNFHGRETP